MQTNDLRGVKPTDRSTHRDASNRSLPESNHPSARQLAEPERDDTRAIHCPDCGADVTATKGGHPTPDHVPGETTHGWACTDCALTLPANCVGLDAPHYTERMVGVAAQFRDDTTRIIPIPQAQRDRALATDGGQDPTFHCDRGDHEVAGEPVRVEADTDSEGLYRVCTDCASIAPDDAPAVDAAALVTDALACEGVRFVSVRPHRQLDYFVSIDFEDAVSEDCSALADGALSSHPLRELRRDYDLGIWRVRFTERTLTLVPLANYDYQSAEGES